MGSSQATSHSPAPLAQTPLAARWGAIRTGASEATGLPRPGGTPYHVPGQLHGSP